LFFPVLIQRMKPTGKHQEKLQLYSNFNLKAKTKVNYVAVPKTKARNYSSTNYPLPIDKSQKRPVCYIRNVVRLFFQTQNPPNINPVIPSAAEESIKTPPGLAPHQLSLGSRLIGAGQAEK